jgi:hypothetical protein
MSPIYLITRREVLMNRDAEFPLTPEMERNLEILLERLNKFRWKYGMPMKRTSGYRPGRYNVVAGGAPNSAHLTCEACDFADADRSLTKFILSNPLILEECDLYMEEPLSTPSWVHLQTRRPPSGRRIFRK